MSVEILTIILFSSLIIFLLLGLPLVFVLGGVAMVFIFFTWGPQGLYMVCFQTWGYMNSFVLVAVPLFILMAMILQESGAAHDLYNMMHVWFGSLRGGLAIGTVIICAIFAAMAGNSAAGTVSMGTVALPEMLKRNYDKKIAIGCIACAGAWGILIPPSIVMIIYALVAGESVGKLFAGGILPGLLLLILVSMYIGIRSFLQPHLAPALAVEERKGWKEKLISLKAVLLPVLIVVMVLGSIVGGFATPTEAAAMGVLGAFISAAVYRQLSWDLIKDVCLSTFRLSGMIMWILFGAACFNGVYQGIGAAEFVKKLMLLIPGGPWGTIIVIQFILFALAMVMDPSGIILITVPIFLPVIKALGFDPVWFGILFTIQMEIGYVTPPFGFNLFYMKAVSPPEVKMSDIYRSVVPFTAVQLVGLTIIMIFPWIATYLPTRILG